MPSKTANLQLNRNLPAPPEQLFYAFSTAQGWRDWLCDIARFEAREGQPYFLAWNDGWYAAGVVLECQPPERLVLTWCGADEGLRARVVIELESSNGKTELKLTHQAEPEGQQEWGDLRQEIQRGWEMGLENLASIFDTGEDLRITHQPMLGITVEEFDDEIAQKMEVPVDHGLRIGSVVEGMAAEIAGLQEGDVIVEFGGQPVGSFRDMAVLLRRLRAGDQVTVAYHRGPERRQTTLELGHRPLAEVPLDPEGLAARLEEDKSEVSATLYGLLEGISEAAAARKPGLEDWSVKEVLAHLISTERWWQNWIIELVQDAERDFSPQEGNPEEELRAIIEVHPTVPLLLEALETAQRETIALLRHARPLQQRPGVLWRVGQELFAFPLDHDRLHLRQIEACLAVVGGSTVKAG